MKKNEKGQDMEKESRRSRKGQTYCWNGGGKGKIIEVQLPGFAWGFPA